MPLSGGGSCWVQLPDGVPAAALAARAADKGVLIETGDVFFMDDKPSGNFIRLGYQSIDVKMIEAGVAALADALKEIQSGR